MPLRSVLQQYYTKVALLQAGKGNRNAAELDGWLVARLVDKLDGWVIWTVGGLAD